MNVPKLMADTKSQVQEAQRTRSINSNICAHISGILFYATDKKIKEKILEEIIPLKYVEILCQS
jgi:hypothetical protein